MDHVSSLFTNKDKFLKNIPMQPYSPGDDTPVVLPTPMEPAPPRPLEEPTVPSVPLPKLPTQVLPAASLEREMIRNTIFKIKDQLEILLHLFEGSAAVDLDFTPPPRPAEPPTAEKGARILEGTFTGEKMHSDDGEIFDIPANYASKSKLVAGDRMKLTIPLVGQFIYKQIAPVERNRIRGELVSGSASGQWLVASEGKTYKVLTASITFNKGRIGDEVVLLVPATGNSEWGAIEHIIHRDL